MKKTRRDEMPASGERKLTWSGRVLGVQPRIRLTRSFDQRYHEYVGYALTIQIAGGERPGPLTIGVGPAAQNKFRFQVGGTVAGEALPVGDPDHDIVQLHRASKVRYQPPIEQAAAPPPWVGVAPPLPVYRERGHRRLATQTYEANCRACVWGSRMPVTLIIDQWRPDIRRYRFETFCYGPKSCPLYRPGSTRKVPGRRGMSWEEEDWVDQDATAHRGEDE